MIIHEVSLLRKVNVYYSSKEEGNMSFDCADSFQEKEKIIKNREKFFDKIHLSINNAVFMKPIFGDKIEIITHKDPRIVTKEEIPVDALVTYTPNLILGCCFGDCLPIVIYEEKFKDLLALVHAGRANIVTILPKVFSLFFNHFLIKPKDTKILVGPSIKKESYILPEFCVYREKNHYFWRNCLEEIKLDEEKGKFYRVDMIQAVKNIIESVGIPEENLKESPFNTAENKIFFSHYRAVRNKEKEGRFLAIATLRL